MSTLPVTLGCGGKLEDKTVEEICDYLQEKGLDSLFKVARYTIAYI